MLARLTPSLAVNTDKVKAVLIVVHYDVRGAPEEDENHVAILFDRGPQMTLKKELDFDTVLTALAGGCHYHKAYFDEVGEVDICVQHQEISDKPDTGNAKDRFRQCNAVNIEHLLMPRKDFQ